MNGNGSTDRELKDRELKELHRLFLAFCRLRPDHPDRRARQACAGAVLVHPASKSRHKSACATAMKSLGMAGRHDLRADVMQEAFCQFTQRLTDGSFYYEDQGSGPFGGWLWAQWYACCLDAGRRCRPLWLRGIELRDPIELDVVERPASRGVEKLWELVESAGDPALQDVLIDWAAGLTIRESARSLGLTKSRVARLRERATARLHAIVGPAGPRGAA